MRSAVVVDISARRRARRGGLQPLVVSLDQLEGPAAVALCGRAVRDWLAFNPGETNTFANLSRRAGIAAGTISRILSRETREPRITTVILILKACGFVAARFDYEEDR